MSSRTPSSLAWLARKHARFSGQLEARTNELEKLHLREQVLLREVEQFKIMVAAVDATIRLHEVRLEPKEIASVRPHRSPAFGYGNMTKALLSHFRVNPGKWFTTGELVTVVCASKSVIKEHLDQRYLRCIVRRRLRALAGRRTLARENDWLKGEDEQRWRLHADVLVCGNDAAKVRSCQ